MPTTVITFFTFTEAKYKQALVMALDKLVIYTKHNEPCRTTNYTFMQDAKDPLTMLSVEEWVDDEAFEKHTSSDVFMEFFSVVGPMIEAKHIIVNQKISKTEMLCGFGPRY
jgi:quinol monooxygenase YgiN